MVIVENAQAFEQIADESINNINTSDMDADVLDIIQDRHFIQDNQILLEFVKPIADAVAVLQADDAHIGLVIGEFLKLHNHINDIKGNHKAKTQCLRILVARFEVITESNAHIVGFALTPQFRNIAFSRITEREMSEKLIELARQILRSVTKRQLSNLVTQLVAYRRNDMAFRGHTDGQHARDYWRVIASREVAEELSSLALKLLEFVPQASRIETLFSGMELTKTKLRNRMNVSSIMKSI